MLSKVECGVSEVGRRILEGEFMLSKAGIGVLEVELGIVDINCGVIEVGRVLGLSEVLTQRSQRTQREKAA